MSNADLEGQGGSGNHSMGNMNGMNSMDSDSDAKKRISRVNLGSYAFNMQRFISIQPSRLRQISLLSLLLSIVLLSLSQGPMFYALIVFSICVQGSIVCLFLCSWVLTKDDGTPEMRRVSDPIREGAEGFLRVQYGSIFRMAVFVGIGIFASNVFRSNQPGASGIARLGSFTLGTLSSISFFLGAAASAVSGYISMWVSAHTNIRVAGAAQRSYSETLLVCFRGGAFSAILSLVMCISGISIGYLVNYFLFVIPGTITALEVPLLLTGFGFGASFVALFMQLGGGIYTKAADVGADLVGKVEVGIPEDDPRNPAVIADLVGDMVGDCVGSSADLFESISAEIIGTMILAASVAREAKIEQPVRFVFFPLIVHAFDIVVSTVGIFAVRASKREDDENGPTPNPLGAMKRGYLISLTLALFDFVFATRWLLYSDTAPNAWYHYSACGIIGMITSYIFILSTQYYTDYTYPPVRSIALASTTGHGTNIITGLAWGLKSTTIPSISVSFAVIISYHLGHSSGLGAGHNAGLLGIAVTTMGMLCSAGYVLAMNNMGPIADNAGGIAEMSQQPERVRKTTDLLDATGNVTKAICKGYSVGSAALACFVLFGAFLDEFSEYAKVPFTTVNIAVPEVLVGGLLGVNMIFMISGLSIAAVGKSAGEVVREVRRQFQEHPEIMEWKAKPDYKACVELVTRASLKEMQLPGMLAVCIPTVVGVTFRVIGEYSGRPMLGVEVLGGFMMFATVAGIMMALFLDNVGGAWDNAKKYIELGNHGGKGSDAHKAAVTGDCVGDPCKDTAGPSLHVIIKLLSTTVLVLAPLFISAPNTIVHTGLA